jgi:hypothetical protein
MFRCCGLRFPYGSERSCCSSTRRETLSTVHRRWWWLQQQHQHQMRRKISIAKIPPPLWTTPPASVPPFSSFSCAEMLRRTHPFLRISITNSSNNSIRIRNDDYSTLSRESDEYDTTNPRTNTTISTTTTLQQPIPQLALAYDYIDFEEETEIADLNDNANHPPPHSHHKMNNPTQEYDATQNPFASPSHPANSTTTTTTPTNSPPTSSSISAMYRKYVLLGTGGGGGSGTGGSGGRNRCPKVNDG